MKIVGNFLFLVLLIICGSTVRAENSPLYLDKTAPIDDRVEDLLKRMTLQEKILQLQNRGLGNPNDYNNIFGGLSIGTVHEMNRSAEECKVLIDSLNAYMSRTRLGIPALPCVEGIQGILQNGCTLFPHALAQGSTFNPDLIYKMTEASAEEARAIGLRQVLSPVLDIARDLRWGRIEETYGEDPFLISEMATAFVNGYQDNGVGCMPKHFVAHGSPTGGLNCASVAGGPVELHNLYLYPFRKVIRNTSPLAIMSCYSAYDGVPVSGSRHYMTDILRGELGFDGFVYSDWGSVERLRTFHHAVSSNEEAARQSLIAGIDLDIDDAYKTLEQQVNDSIIDIEYVDNAVRRVLKTKFRLGLFDTPSDYQKYSMSDVHSTPHIALAKEIADESVILLENNGILPLDISKYKSVAVIGPNVDYPVMGDYSWVGNDNEIGVTLLDALKDKIGDKVKINYELGCDWWSQDDSKIKDAVKAAKKSDLIIVGIGTRSTYLGRAPKKSTSGEGFDISSLDLPGQQLKLLQELRKLNKPMIVAFISGKPLVLDWVKENADALLVQWYAGEQQGNALADIILGNVNPSGRLNVSFPRSTGNSPCYYNYYPTDREWASDHGGSPDEAAFRYIFEKPYALWPFGSGLSYTDFTYSNETVSKDNETIRISLDVTNSGERDGKEVVQVYLTDPVSSVLTPVKQLKAFKKVSIPAGETVNVSLEIPFDELMLYNAEGENVLEPGEYIIQIGRSSDDIRYSQSLNI